MEVEAEDRYLMMLVETVAFLLLVVDAKDRYLMMLVETAVHELVAKCWGCVVVVLLMMVGRVEAGLYMCVLDAVLAVQLVFVQCFRRGYFLLLR